MAALFDWKDTFLTGIGLVDDQHRHLVELINDLASRAFDPEASDPEAPGQARDALLDYTRIHFADEEALMHGAGLDPRHIEAHRAQHRSFIDEIRAIDPSQTADTLQPTLRYLMGWLAHHILGIDQAMARQIQARREGLDAAAALEAERAKQRRDSDPLLDALNVMLHVISEKNRELRTANIELEQRVAGRTAELEKANAQLELLAVHDELTGLPNRRFALSALQVLWDESRSEGAPLAVLMIDADRFKAVNDTYGHAEGDAVLRTIATVLRHSVRTNDVVCRLAGDEFLILCPRTDAAGARRVAEKVLQTLASHHTVHGTPTWDGGLSLGVAELEAGMAQPEDLIEAADRALYDAKHRGGAQCA